MTTRKNHIEKTRREILKYFNPEALIVGTSQRFSSPNGKYLAKTSHYKQSKPDCNWDVTKFEIYEIGCETVMLSFLSNYHTTFHQWVSVNNRDYLLCAEDIYGGQTIVDLNARRIESFSPGIDGFISTDYHPSPTGELLATFGCIWAYPYRIKLFDFRDPLNLPWPEIPGEELFEDHADFVEWVNTFQIKVKQESGQTQFIDVSVPFEKVKSKLLKKIKEA